MINGIFKFAKQLLPRIDRATVEEDLRITEKECVNVVRPSWDAAATFFKLNKPTSQEADEMSLTFYRNFDLRKAGKSPNFILDIAKRVPALHDNVVLLQSVIDDHLQKDIITEGLTVQSAFVLRAVGNISLVTRYLLALLNYLYTVEAAEHDTALEPGLEISQAEMKYVERNFELFVKLFSTYTQPTKDFEALLGAAPKVFINDSSAQAVSGLYGKGFDPMETIGLAGFIGNPIYKIRLIVAKWQNDRYNSAKDKKQQLELRLLYLQMQKNEKVDPGVVKEIERLQMRIENYDRYLREVEEKVGA